MQALILAGGYGTRIIEESHNKPKPMIEVLGKPILLRIMEHYSHYGVQEFIILAGYKKEKITEFFLNFTAKNSDVQFDLRAGTFKASDNGIPEWKVTILDTGLNSETGLRLYKAREHIKGKFLLTYGDGLSDLNITESIKFHDSLESIATLTAVQPPARFGAIEFGPDNLSVVKFKEKPQSEESWVNGGYFVLDEKIFDFINGENMSFENEILPIVAKLNKLSAFKHYGYWQPMDTLRDLRKMEQDLQENDFPWS